MTEPKLEYKKFPFYLKTNWSEYYYEDIHTYMTDVRTFSNGVEKLTVDGQKMITFISKEIHVMIPQKQNSLMRMTLSLNKSTDEYIHMHLKHFQDLYGGEILEIPKTINN